MSEPNEIIVDATVMLERMTVEVNLLRAENVRLRSQTEVGALVEALTRILKQTNGPSYTMAGVISKIASDALSLPAAVAHMKKEEPKP